MQIKTLSLNIWGVPFVAKFRQARINAIAEFLLLQNVDIVGFQEIWIREDYVFLTGQLQTVYPYTYYFRSGIIGSGLAVFSKYPIVEVSIKRFSSNGKPQRLLHGDWLGGKAVGLCRIKLPNGSLIDFFNTHLHACYVADQTKDEYIAHRISQVWELAQFIRHTRRNYVILVGDLNLNDENVGYLLLTSDNSVGGMSLVDAFIDTSTNEEKKLEMLDNLKLEVTEGSNEWQDAISGVTSQAPSNSFAIGMVEEYSERIDYTFFYPTPCFNLLYSRSTLLQKIEIGTTRKLCSYSDHYGILSVFEIGDKKMKRDSSFPISNLVSNSISPNVSTAMLDSPVMDENVDMINVLQINNVNEYDIMNSITKILTWGIFDALHRHNWNFYGFCVFISLEVVLIVLSFMFVLSWASLVSALLMLPICYNILMIRFIIPEEVSSLERVRSEVLIHIQGNVDVLHKSIPARIVKLLSKKSSVRINERRNSLLDPGPTSLVRTESAVLISGISNAILGSRDHPPSQLF